MQQSTMSIAVNPIIYEVKLKHSLPGGHQMKTSLYIAHKKQLMRQAPNQACSTAFPEKEVPLLKKTLSWLI
jgi:hypothetical protein